MKKTVSIILMLVVAVLLFSTATIPAMAAGIDSDAGSGFFEPVNNSNKTFHDLMNDPEEMLSLFDQEFEDVKQQREEEEKQWQEEWNSIRRRQNTFKNVIITIGIIAVFLVIAEITYIFITAPKCGMSRFWALVPLFSNFVGLLVFIIVRSNRKACSNTHIITCPTCNSRHSEGTIECSICGTKLQ